MRGVNVRLHHRQLASEAGSETGSSAVVTDRLPQFAVIAAAEFDDLGNCSTTPKLSTIGTIYSHKDIKAIRSMLFIGSGGSVFRKRSGQLHP